MRLTTGQKFRAPIIIGGWIFILWGVIFMSFKLYHSYSDSMDPRNDRYAQGACP